MSKTKTLKSKHFKAYQRQTFQNEVLSDPNFVFHSLLILFPPKISTFGANPSQKKFLQLCKIRAENHFLSLLLICRGVFPADYRPIHYKFCHLLQRSSIKLERRRCGSPVRSPLLCCPSLWYHSLDIRNGFFSKRQMMWCCWHHFEKAWQCGPSIERVAFVSWSSWGLGSEKATDFFLLEVKPWLKTRRFVALFVVLFVCLFIFLIPFPPDGDFFSGAINAKHWFVKFNGNFSCR